MSDVSNWPRQWSFGRGARPTRADHAMVATTDRLASEVGIEVLADGGNAVDAAVAIGFALAVVNPEAGNLGGGGFMVLRSAEGELSALDFRSTAPAAALPNLFAGNRGKPDDPSVLGHLAAGVPGTVRGLWDAHARFGRTPWERLVEPAVGLASSFRVSARFLESFPRHIVEGLARFPSSAEIFLDGGAPPALGSSFSQPDLGRTLGRIRDRGPDGFYAGETAKLIVREMTCGGGIVSESDLAGYRSAWRQPLQVDYRGHTVVSMPPPSSGGVTLALAFGVLSALDGPLAPWHSTQHLHVMAEAWRRAFADRNHYLADPDFVEVPTAILTSAAYTRWRAVDFETAVATPSASIRPGLGAFSAGKAPADAGAKPPSASEEGDHTTHYSVVDPEGNAASVTTTLNTWYGSKVVAEGTGVLLNNEMDDFTARPGVPNFFGLVQGEANSVQPGKRMLSAMTPTIVVGPDARLRLVVGTPGGATIITTVFQVVSNVLDYGMNIARAVDAPRIHHQHLPDQVEYEPEGLSPDTISELELLGHRVVERDEVSGDVQAIEVRPDGSLEGRSDPRRGGSVSAY